MIERRLRRLAGGILFLAGTWALQAQAPASLQTAPPTAPAAAPGTTPATMPGTPGPNGTTITIVMPDGSTRAQIVLAIPPLTNLSALQGTAGNAARTLDQTLRRDLDKSGIFRLQEAEELSVLSLTGNLDHDADQYRSLGAEMLLQNEVKLDGDRLVIEGRLIDLASRQPIVGKRYRGTYDLARRMAHTFADEIILYLTGKRGIALTSIAFSSDRDGEKEIYLMDYDGFDQRRITGHRSISMSPAWSPTGDVLSYVSFFGGDGPAIYLADIQSGRKSPVITSGSLNTSPTFSPDGKRMAFARGIGANIEIFTCRRDGSDLRQLTSSPGIDTNPAWSPNGNEIAFTSSRSGSPQIYVVDSEGTNLRRITFEGEYNDGAAWSPDGTRIAFATRAQQNRFDLSMVDLVTLAAQRLTDGNGSNESPAFSPDGRRIAFSSTRAGGVQIFIMEARYGAPAEQVTFEGANRAPDWSGYLP
ncbi:MAG: Tol-Pal system beta propeller repeat protein TolB [Thermoanaerobaculia bacterium]